MILNTEIGKRAVGMTLKPEHAYNGVIRSARKHKHAVARPQNAEQGNRKGMCARRKRMADYCVFGAHTVGKNAV